LLVAILAILIISTIVKDEEDVAVLCQSIVFAGYVVFVQLYQNVRANKGTWGAGDVDQFRYSTDSMQPNVVAWILAFAAAFAWMLITWNRKSTRPFLLVNYGILLVALIGVFYTGSRGGFIALVVAYIPAIIGLWKRPIGAALIGSTLTVTLPAALASPQIQGSLSRILNLGSSVATDGMSGRLDLWEAAIHIAKDKPFLGSGIGGFNVESSRLGLNTTSGVTGAHQAFLDVLCQTGAVGLILFCLLWFQMVKAILKFPRELKLTGWCVMFSILSVLLGTHEQTNSYVILPTFILYEISLVYNERLQQSYAIRKDGLGAILPGVKLK
jgi:hypothetical protein